MAYAMADGSMLLFMENNADEYLNHAGLRYASQFGASQAAAWMRG
jgi:hypothetical protein